MERNNKALIIVIIILSVWVAILSGFFIYDRVLDKKEPEVKEPEKDINSTTIPKPQTPTPVEDHSAILNGGWYQNDADVVNIDYKSIKTEGTINGLQIKYECDEKEEIVCEADTPDCIEKICTNKYTINNKISFNNNNKASGVCYEPVVLSYKDYVIIYTYGCTMTGSMKVYDKNGILKKEKRIDLSQEETTYYPVIHNQKLYYYERLDQSEGGPTELKYIDLTTSNLTETIVK